MANEETITHYFNLLKNTLIEADIIDSDTENIKSERCYAADETGWGAGVMCTDGIIYCGFKRFIYTCTNQTFRSSQIHFIPLPTSATGEKFEK